MGGRAVEGTGLENRQAGDRLVGSNPTPSAIPLFGIQVRFSEFTLGYGSVLIRLRTMSPVSGTAVTLIS